MHRPIVSTIKILGFLGIALVACGDDNSAPGTSAPDTTDTTETTDTPDTAEVGATSGPDSDDDTSADTTGQPDTTGGTGVNTDPGAVVTTAVDDHSRTVVNASSSALWTHLSLSTGQLAIPAPTGSDAFHLGFQRYLVKLGQGVSALTLDGVAFASLTAAPTVDETEWKVDDSTSETAAISDWWDYDGQTHVLSAKPDRLYVIAAEGRYFKLRFRDYYDQGGSPGFVTFDWDEIDAPSPAPSTRTLTLALSPAAHVYADLRNHTTSTSAQGAGSLTWDLAALRVSVQTNGGTSGAGQGGALLLGEGGLDAFTSLPADATFTADAMFPVAGPPGSGEESRNAVLDGFYTYDPTTHSVTVNPRVFALRLADGSVVKLRFLSWSSTSLSFEYAPLEAAGE